MGIIQAFPFWAETRAGEKNKAKPKNKRGKPQKRRFLLMILL